MSLSIQRNLRTSPPLLWAFRTFVRTRMAVKPSTLMPAATRKCYIQFPFMRSPFGLSAFTDEGTGRTTYSLDLSFDPDNEQAMLVHKQALRARRTSSSTPSPRTLRSGSVRSSTSRFSRKLSTSQWFALVRSSTRLP